MNKFKQIFKSRTFYVILISGVMSVFQALDHMFPNGVYATALTILTALASYFHVNPSQPYQEGDMM